MTNNTPPIYSLDLTQLSNISTQQIDSWLEQYPYAHNLHALKILGAKAKKDPDFATILNSEIMYIPDRSHLKKLIENLDQIVLPEIPEAIVESSNTNELESINELDTLTDVENEYESIIEENTLENTINDNKIEPLTEEIVTPEEPAIIEIKQNEELSPLIEEPVPDTTSNSMEDKETFKINEDTDFLQEEEDDKDLSDFSRWLKSKTSMNVIDNPVESINMIVSGPTNEWEGIQEKILASYHTGALGKEEKLKKDSGDKKKKKLKPKIDETEVITESYALLLEQQGKIGKAIKIYEKLSLIIPEKTTYFADKIEYLKNK